MKLLTQEQGSQLKKGDLVNVVWFSPRKSKDNPEAPSREYGGRAEYMESVWRDCVVMGAPHLTASDGYMVSVFYPREGGTKPVLTDHLELA